MNTNSDLQNKLEALKAEHAAKLEKQTRELVLADKLNRLTGLHFTVLIHQWKSTETISAWIENSQFNRVDKFDRYRIAEYYAALCAEFTPVAKKVEVNRVDKFNVSPVTVTIHNNENEGCFHHQTMAEVECSFDGGLTVAFKLPVYGNFDNSVMGVGNFELTPENGGRKMRKQTYGLVGFDRVNWYGGDKLTFTTDSAKVENLINIAFTGKSI